MNYLILSNSNFIKNKLKDIQTGAGFYFNNKFAICCSVNTVNKKEYSSEDIDLVKRLFLTVKIEGYNILTDDDPAVLKNSIRKNIKINKGLIKDLINRFNELKYFPELYTVIALFFIRDNRFIFYHNEYLCNIRKFIEMKYFYSCSSSLGHRDNEAWEISNRIYNKYINSEYSPESFLDYIFDELRIYLSFRNSYNIKIRETRRRMTYFKDNDNKKEFNNRKIYDISSGSGDYLNHFNNITANEIMKFLKDNKLIPDNTSIDEVFDFLTPEIIGILKNKYIEGGING